MDGPLVIFEISSRNVLYFFVEFRSAVKDGLGQGSFKAFVELLFVLFSQRRNTKGDL